MTEISAETATVEAVMPEEAAELPLGRIVRSFALLSLALSLVPFSSRIDIAP